MTNHTVLVSLSPPPRVSVLMCAYNAERYLREAMESILNQTYTNFEFIIVDDGSTDSTAEILDSYHDARIVRLRNNPNQGVARALNRGLATARGEYIARMDADDVSEPTRLEKQIQYLDVHPEIAVLGTGLRLIQNEIQSAVEFSTSQIPEVLAWELSWTCCVYHPTVMMRRSVVLEMGGYDERFWCSEDYHLWMRMMKDGQRITNLKEPLLWYRIWSTQISSQHESEQRQQSVEIAREYLEWLLNRKVLSEHVGWMFKLYRDEALGNARELLIALNLAYLVYKQCLDLPRSGAGKQIRNRVSDSLIFRAAGELKRGQRKQARFMLFSAIRLHPLRALRPWTFQLLLQSFR